MEPLSRIYVAGHRGLVGSALMRALKSQGCSNVITRTHAELDLTNQAAVQRFFAGEKPEYVFLAAAKGVVFMPMTPIPLNLFTRIWQYRPTSSMSPGEQVYNDCCFWVHHAYIRETASSQSKKNTC
jgi:hypothetical protein